MEWIKAYLFNLLAQADTLKQKTIGILENAKKLNYFENW